MDLLSWVVQCVKFYSVFISSLMQAVLLLVKQALNLFHNLTHALKQTCGRRPTLAACTCSNPKCLSVIGNAKNSESNPACTSYRCLGWILFCFEIYLLNGQVSESENPLVLQIRGHLEVAISSASTASEKKKEAALNHSKYTLQGKGVTKNNQKTENKIYGFNKTHSKIESRVQKSLSNVSVGRPIFFSAQCKSGIKWCQTHRDLQQTPVRDPQCCWSLTVSSGTAESRKSDVNTTDWWRTVKLPFVREKQEASCGRPSLSGWEETAGRKRKNHLKISKRLLTTHLNPYGPLTWSQPLLVSFFSTLFSNMKVIILFFSGIC